MVPLLYVIQLNIVYYAHNHSVVVCCLSFHGALGKKNNAVKMRCKSGRGEEDEKKWEEREWSELYNIESRLLKKHFSDPLEACQIFS